MYLEIIEMYLAYEKNDKSAQENQISPENQLAVEKRSSIRYMQILDDLQCH